MDKIKDIEKLILDSISNRYSNSKESYTFYNYPGNWKSNWYYLPVVEILYLKIIVIL
ncbi:MAG: hypothetical protein KAT68_08575 [Bacteroidales bacterium]|nr:hypothetical protein [Bacteroidales bacterium]